MYIFFYIEKSVIYLRVYVNRILQNTDVNTESLVFKLENYQYTIVRICHCTVYWNAILLSNGNCLKNRIAQEFYCYKTRIVSATHTSWNRIVLYVRRTYVFTFAVQIIQTRTIFANTALSSLFRDTRSIKYYAAIHVFIWFHKSR